MKICMPVSENNGLQSTPYGHFGSAPFFMVYDTETKAIHTINNGDLHHEHGMCQPIRALGGEAIDVILVGGIGKGALIKLNELGMKVYQAASATFEENIQAYVANQLPAFETSHVCTGHDCGHHHG